MDENIRYRLLLILESAPSGGTIYQVRLDGSRTWELNEDDPIIAINTEAGDHSIEVSEGRRLDRSVMFSIPRGQNVTKVFVRAGVSQIDIRVDAGAQTRPRRGRDAEPAAFASAGRQTSSRGGARVPGYIGMLVLGLVCGLLLSRAIWPSSTRPPAVTAPPEETQPVETSAPPESGDYSVEVRDARRTADAAGNPAVVVSYAWTNDGAESVNAAGLFRAKAFQDGVQLDAAEVADIGLYDPTAYARELRPGATLELQAPFLLTSETAVIEFEVSPLPDVPGTPVLVEFDPAELE